MNSSTIYEVVETLIGDVVPIGDASHDCDSNYNVLNLCRVTETSVARIFDLYDKTSGDKRGSVAKCNRELQDVIISMQDYFNEYENK